MWKKINFSTYFDNLNFRAKNALKHYLNFVPKYFDYLNFRAKNALFETLFEFCAKLSIF